MQDATTCPSNIRHPVWCKHVDDDNARFAGDGTFSLLGPVEPDGEHEGRSYTLDAGDTFAYTVTVTPVQWFGDDASVEQPPTLRIAAQNHELTGDGEIVYLRMHEVDKLILMLQRASQIL